MALFHCMVQHGTVHFWGVFHWVQYLVSGHLFSTTSVEVPSEPYSYQNVTCKLLITEWPEKIFTANLRTRHNRPARFKSAQSAKDRTQLFWMSAPFFNNQKNGCFVVCWGSTDVPLVDNRGADPARAWWSDAEWQSSLYPTLKRY